MTVRPGTALPLGVHDCCDGFNFAVFSRHAQRLELLIFQHPADTEPRAVIALDAAGHRTGDIWHARVGGIDWGCAYAVRAYGPWAPERGHRFDPKRLLLDPYARALAGVGRCVLADNRFDWEGDAPPKHRWSDTVIYEAHVRGLTIHPSAAVAHPGTFLGLIEKIPYLRELGVTALELMPVQAFSERQSGRRDYWGYNPIAFFAPEERYAAGARPGGQVDEFKTMVKALHRAGIEVILDVVFNHTGEGDETGPTFSFRGLDNSIYYMLQEDRRYYRDYTGCRNTFNANHPVVHELIIDCLRYWVSEMHVDGFRFDLASVLGRGTDGRLLANPPLLESIAEDAILRGVKLIAEAWDAAGAFQVGNFPGPRWAEWNSRYRDDVRRFWRGDPGMTGAFASRLCGSSDLYQHSGKSPINSINFITCHDGFTLNDLVSYVRKHNDANGERGRDGADENFSANHGVEGPSEDPAIEALRLRQMKNMLATLLVSRGVPMLLGGDEFRRTQRGNNNAWCQDNKISWYDWRLLERDREVFDFVRRLVALRHRFPQLRAETFYRPEEIRWFGADAAVPDWHGAAGVLGCAISAMEDAPELCLLFNASTAPVQFVLPDAGEARAWTLLVDTSRPAPALDTPRSYTLQSRSMAILCGIE